MIDGARGRASVGHAIRRMPYRLPTPVSGPPSAAAMYDSIPTLKTAVRKQAGLCAEHFGREESLRHQQGPEIMNRIAVPVISVITVLSVGSIANASMPSFRGVGDLPGGQSWSNVRAVSADGRVVIGDSRSSSGGESFRWEDGAMVGLGDLPGGSYGSIATAVSADGSVIAGVATVEFDQNVAFRWENGVMSALPSLPGLPGYPGHSFPHGVSGDGRIIVGHDYTPDGQRAARWDNGIVSLIPDGPDGTRARSANSISTDGTTIVGSADVPGAGAQAFRFTAADGLVPLRTEVVTDESSFAYGVSANGSYIVGRDEQAAGFISEGFRWDNGGFMGFGNQTPDGLAVSADGSIVVLGALWQEGIGIRPVGDILTSDYGLDLGGWSALNAIDISDDGTVIVGNGRNPDGNFEGWIATIPEPASVAMLLVAVGAIGARRRQRGPGRHACP